MPTFQQSRIFLVAKKLFSPELRLFSLTLLYYLSLYFSINNRTLLVFSLVYVALLYLSTGSIKRALFLAFVVTLPFAKGKGYQILLLPKEQIERYALFKLSYFFPLYLSDFLLFLLFYTYTREKLKGKGGIVIAQRTKPALFLLLVFIIVVVLNAFRSIFPEVILLSSLQLVKLMFVFVLPIIIGLKQKDYSNFFAVISASLVFQALWVFLQRISGGPLGKDIEVFLPGAEFGIRSPENIELLRTTGTFFEPSILGTFLLMQIGALLPLFVRGDVRQNRLSQVALVAAAAASVALVFTGSRILYGIWVGLAILLIWYRRSYQGSVIRLLPRQFFGKLAIVVAVIAALALPYIVVRLQSLPDAFTQYGTATYRLQMMVYATRVALASPFIGVGINLSPYYFATGFAGERFVFDPTYPHNLFFQLLAETGIIGTVFFLLFAATVLRPLVFGLRQGRLNGFRLAAAIYLASALFYPIFLNHPELSSYFFLYAGMATFAMRGKEHDA